MVEVCRPFHATDRLQRGLLARPTEFVVSPVGGSACDSRVVVDTASITLDCRVTFDVIDRLKVKGPLPGCDDRLRW